LLFCSCSRQRHPEPLRLGQGLTREWLSHGWNVIATVRGGSHTGHHDIVEASDSRLAIETFEMTDVATVASHRRWLSGTKLDQVFVNAGVANESDDCVDEVTTEDFKRLMVTNALSPIPIIARLGKLVHPSKAAPNTLVRSHAARHSIGRSLASVDPAGRD
jgi:NAD(P)-dependent dehydrogenase (short-subunit alcohol dehydrogenase family)